MYQRFLALPALDKQPDFRSGIGIKAGPFGGVSKRLFGVSLTVAGLVGPGKQLSMKSRCRVRMDLWEVTMDRC
jgi:hypothetical protein